MELDFCSECQRRGNLPGRNAVLYARRRFSLPHRIGRGPSLLVLLFLLLSQSAQQGSCTVSEQRVPKSTATILDGKVEATLEIDRFEYTSDPANISIVRAKLTLRNLTPQPIPFHFNSGQITDWTLMNSSGKKTWRWSDGRVFSMVVLDRTLESTPWEFEEEIPLASESNKPYPPGNYILKAELAADKKVEITINFRIIL